MTAFHQTLGLLVHDIRHFHVVLGGLVKGAGDDLGMYAAGHIRHLLRTLVYQKHNHVHLRMIERNGVGHLLQQHRLTGLGLRYNQSALTLADRRKQVDNAATERVVMPRAQLEFRVREEWSQMLESHAVANLFRQATVDLLYAAHREIAVSVLGRENRAFHGVAGLQPVLFDLLRRHVDVVWRG